MSVAQLSQEFNYMMKDDSCSCSEEDSFNRFEIESEEEMVEEDPRQAWLDRVEKLQENGWREPIFQYCPDFKGYCWRLCNNWFNTVPEFEGPIVYLEIGTLCGANLISVCKTYGRHPDSRFHVIDPWCDSPSYNEYRTPDGHPFNVQENNYQCFLYNIESSGEKDRVTVYRDFSYDVLIYLQEESYDLIYIDGSHNAPDVLEDAVLAFRRAKVGGWIVFDDYDWQDEFGNGPKSAIDAFFQVYKDKLANVQVIRGQAFCQKKMT